MMMLIHYWGDSSGRMGKSETSNVGLKVYHLSHLAYPIISIVSQV